MVIFLSRQTTRRQQPSRYGQRGQGMNGGSVKIWTGVWVKQAGCCYSTVVVTQWNTDVKNSHQHTVTLYAKGLTCEADTLGSCGYVYLAVYPTPETKK
ncbi:type IV toxin-antitoxin system YeeU family antitoxin [Escherichia coli]|uniref:type IV toxin-antitoxin system YeeU family antitoxin n=2 Tax=Escherichia coli TaxID=562 RepID=UPI0020232A61|nr:type IV toxin-antitoxin system YeeU family antitoxin [Escherichia coli]